jgi:hypothetical protein
VPEGLRKNDLWKTLPALCDFLSMHKTKPFVQEAAEEAMVLDQLRAAWFQWHEASQPKVEHSPQSSSEKVVPSHCYCKVLF